MCHRVLFRESESKEERRTDDIKDGKIFRHLRAHSINFHQMLPICAIGLNSLVLRASTPFMLCMHIVLAVSIYSQQSHPHLEKKFYKNENLHLFGTILEMQHNIQDIMSSTVTGVKDPINIIYTRSIRGFSSLHSTLPIHISRSGKKMRKNAIKKCHGEQQSMAVIRKSMV